jgi:hypothetical protein
LGRAIDHGDFFKTAGGVPLFASAGGKQADPGKQGRLARAFYVVGLEGKPPDLAIYLIEGGVFFKTTTRLG